MKKNAFFTAMIIMSCLFFSHTDARAQSEPAKSEATEYEIGVQFSSLSLDGYQIRTKPGLGSRFAFNLNNNLALETQTDFFPDNERFSGFRNTGRAFQGLFGVKAGKRWSNFGIFGKARPGFITFTRGVSDIVITGAPAAEGGLPLFIIRPRRLTHFAVDVGGALEFYVSRRILTRFDAGGLIIRSGATTVQTFTSIDPFVIAPQRIVGETTINFQFSAGIGYRF